MRHQECSPIRLALVIGVLNDLSSCHLPAAADVEMRRYLGLRSTDPTNELIGIGRLK
jgi:hypothetical protein